MAAVQIKKILVALDLSTQASNVTERVAEYAICLAKALEAEILAIHITPALLPHYGRFRVPASVMENFKDEVIGEAEKNMTELVKTKFQGLKAQGRVVNGQPADEILNQAKESNADLIVMGTHNQAGLGRFFFGSVAEKVVKNAGIPVMSIRPDITTAK